MAAALILSCLCDDIAGEQTTTPPNEEAVDGEAISIEEETLSEPISLDSSAETSSIVVIDDIPQIDTSTASGIRVVSLSDGDVLPE